MAGAPGDPAAVHVEIEADDGPPPPPPVRRRRRRRRRIGIAAAIVVVVGVPVGLAAAGVFSPDDPPSASDTDAGSDAEAEDPSGESDSDADDPDGDAGEGSDALDAPDLGALTGSDVVYGQLLVDIDVSERVMMAFQDEVASIFSTPAGSPDELVESLQEAGSVGRDELLEARERFDETLDEEGAEEIRDRYVAHLDSWVDYMDAVADDPSVLGGEGAGAGYTVVINATADAFARSLEERLPDTADASVSDYADDILDRGFRGSGDAQV